MANTSPNIFLYNFNILDYYSLEDIRNVIQNPMVYNDVLREMSRMLYSTNGIYTNTIDYMVAMPTLDKVLVPFGKSKRKKQENKRLVESVLSNIRDKEVIRDSLFNGMIDGIVFNYFETKKMPMMKKTFNDFEIGSIFELNSVDGDTTINVSVISLPVDYCKIIGYINNIPQVAFNLDYFTDNTNETEAMKLSKVPEEIRLAYKQKKDSLSNNNWVRLDYKKTMVHKIKSSRKEIWGRPLVLSAIRDILYSDYFTQTKRNVLDEINNRIVYETFPEGKEKGTSGSYEERKYWKIETSCGEFEADSVIFAAGSNAAPKTGSDSSIYPLIKELKHDFSPFMPALCGLKTEAIVLEMLKGVRAEAGVSLHVYSDNDMMLYQSRGEVQISSEGISGVCVMDISRYAAIALKRGYDVELSCILRC